MRRLSFASLLFVLLAMLLAGCASDRRQQALTQTLHQYGATLRWGDFASAQQFLEPAYREAHPISSIDTSRYAQVRVSMYDDGQGPVPGEENEVRQIVQIGLINNNTQAERTVIDRQVWRYDPEKNKWWLTSGLPNINPQ
jgi:hypothetical protein